MTEIAIVSLDYCIAIRIINIVSISGCRPFKISITMVIGQHLPVDILDFCTNVEAVCTQGDEGMHTIVIIVYILFLLE